MSEPVVEVFAPNVMLEYANVTGWILARALACCGEAGTIERFVEGEAAVDSPRVDPCG